MILENVVQKPTGIEPRNFRIKGLEAISYATSNENHLSTDEWFLKVLFLHNARPKESLRHVRIRNKG